LFGTVTVPLSVKEGLDNMLLSSLEKAPHLINFYWMGEYLPDKYKISLTKEKLYDFDGAFEFIDKI
jgi:hypothetical protein